MGTDPSRDTAVETVSSSPSGNWAYEEAFSRHRGLISKTEQERLRNSRVAVVGMGGVGGVDLVTLARLGIGQFTIADPDTFEVSNTNRQYGAANSTLGTLTTVRSTVRKRVDRMPMSSTVPIRSPKRQNSPTLTG